MVSISMEKIGVLRPPSPRIFVFGSNLAGRHGKGAALHARIYYGAQLGVAIGHIGQSYAIPTKDQNLKSLDLETIGHHIKGFLAYAKAHPDLQFNVTQIGCGLAGYKPEQITPMFRDPPGNCWFDPAWIHKVNTSPHNFWEPGTL